MWLAGLFTKPMGLLAPGWVCMRFTTSMDCACSLPKQPSASLSDPCEPAVVHSVCAVYNTVSM
jgi:hypothetical protein